MIDIAFDLAGTTGYAIHYDTGELKVGNWNLVRGNLGGARSIVPARRLRDRLVSLSYSHEIRRIGFEETFGRGAAKFRLDSLQTVVMIFAMDIGVSWSRFPVPTIKKHATGNARAGKPEMVKAAMVKWPTVKIHTTDQADALWVLDLMGKGGG